MTDIQQRIRIAEREGARKAAFEEAAKIAEEFESDGNPFPTIQGAIARAIRAAALSSDARGTA